ncbi:MAG: efflux RND transporter permease subunit, partial [Bdellovibrionales bacterium]
MRTKIQFIKNAKVLAIGALIFAGATMVFGGLSLHKLQTTYSIMQFLPANHPALKMDNAVRARFHLEDHPTFIGVLNLKKTELGTWLQPARIKRLEKLTARLKALTGVDQAMSVANVEGAASVKGAISVGELVKLVPAKEWKERILNDNLLSPNLIAEDGRTVLIYVQLKQADVQGLVHTQSRFKSLLTASFPEANASIGGVPAVQTDLGLLLNKELINFLGLTILACALTLVLIFRTLSTIWIPLILVGYCNLMVFTMMAWTGITFTILSSTIPILVFIDVMTIATHILLRMHEEAQHAPERESRWSLIVRTSKTIWLPNVLGSCTTCVGFLTLLLSDVPLIRTYGLGVAIAILMSSLLTSIGIIPLLLLFPMPEPRAWVHRPARWALWITENSKAVVAFTLAVCCVFAFVGRKLDWTGRLFDDLPKGQEARRSTERIDRTMGGVVPLEIVVKAPRGKDWSDPVRIAKLDNLISDLRLTRGVGTAQSLPDFLRASRLHKAALPRHA